MVENNLDKKSRCDLKTLKIFSKMEFVLILIIIILFDQFSINFFVISPLLSGLFIPLSYIWVFIAKQRASYPHSFKKHPVCYLGQRWVFGKDNFKANLWVQGFFIGFGLNFIIVGSFLRNSFQFNPYLQITAWILYFCALLVIIMGIIPIDLYRKIHLAVTFIFFGLHYAATIVFLFYFRYMRHFGIYVHTLVYAGCVIHLLGSTLYLIAYVFQRKASLFQNGWFLGSFFGLWATIAGLFEIFQKMSI